MRSIKKARLLIEADPLSKASQVIASLVSSLESENRFDLNSLYQLDLEQFELAIKVMKDWRVDRYYMGKAKIFDLAIQAVQLPTQTHRKEQ